MSALKIPYLKEMSPETPVTCTDRMMTEGAKLNIDKINWNDYPFIIDVKVNLGYSDHYLWLNYIVEKELVRAVCRMDQEPVWQDSCVEFFISQGDIYRNFEFNSLGVCLSASGVDRHDRKSLESDAMAKITRFPSLNIENLPDENTPANWTLMVAIPLDIIGLEAGSQFRANFYKCGDETKVPHYLSWSAITTPSPDFHRPEYFDLLELVK